MKTSDASASPTAPTGLEHVLHDATKGRDHSEQTRPYSAFSKNQKWTIVGLVALAAFFRCVCCPHVLRMYAHYRRISPFTANIYFPAIPAMSRAFHKSTELINLTVTVYMVFQGICE